MPSVMISFRLLAQQPPALEVGQEAPPGLGVLHLGKLEGEQFPAALIFSRLWPMDAEGAQHHFFLNADLPDLLADAIEEQELHRIAQGLGLR